jgi:hypothetical protein
MLKEFIPSSSLSVACCLLWIFGGSGWADRALVPHLDLGARHDLEQAASLNPRWIDPQLEGKEEEALTIFSKYRGNADAEEGLCQIENKKESLTEPIFLQVDVRHAEEVEHDPSLRAPVAKTYYDTARVFVQFPVTPQVELQVGQLFFRQEEHDLFPPCGVNFDNFAYGAEVQGRSHLMGRAQIRVGGRLFEMQGSSKNVYPFRRVLRFEPNVSWLWKAPLWGYFAEAHRDSLIIKNFARVRSELLPFDHVGIGSFVNPCGDLKVAWQGEGFRIWIRDELGNRKWTASSEISLALPLPSLIRWMRGFYRFEWGSFDQLNVNYYSFRNQLRSVLGFRIDYSWRDLFQWEIEGWHRWETTYNLFQPIGDFVTVARKRYLVAQAVTARWTTHFWQVCDVVVEGNYQRDSLPDRQWGVKGKMVYWF